ncbi:class E sortase [Streptomyces sp. NPDC007863]|uniref:class E sortase n=1 Tax=Streptomyces sp. NPDC007863 TaxID=3154894 RepID=UPI0033E5FF7B
MTTGSPWFRASAQPGAEPIPEDHGGQAPEPRPYDQSAYDQQGPYEQQGLYDQQGPYEQQSRYEQQGLYEQQGPYEQGGYGYEQQGPYPYPYPSPAQSGYEPQAQPQPQPQAPVYEPPREAVHEPLREPYEAEGARETPEVAEEAPRPVEALPGPGRAERRRAAAKQGRGKSRPAAGPATGTPAGTPAERPLSRVEARRAAREAKAAKDSVGVVVGELFITLGVVMLLFVAYQLWWTNVLAGQETDQAKERIEDTWAKGENKPDVFAPGEGFAIMYIPKLDVVVPVAEGISKPKVLDKGMVGHYGEGKLKTAMPSDKQGNFAVAGHRNTHGEPFRYINRLKPGDPIVVETQDAYYTYEMASILPQTAPSNIAVIDPVPKGSGFTGPGRYITLTTCTPEFTSTYRMIVWGKLVEERPRSKGKPTALVG